MSKDHAIHDFYNLIYRKYDLINRIFTLNSDQRWRKNTAKSCLNENPEKVLDLCCGTGDLTIALSKFATSNIEIIGCDFNLNMLKQAEKKVKILKYNNIRFVQGDASNLQFDNNNFNCITIGFGYRNLTFENSRSIQHISEISRVLKAGGKLLLLESGVPENKIVRLFYSIYLRLILIPLGGLISGNWKAYQYLAYSSSNFFNIKQTSEMLAPYGLVLLEYRKFLFGSANLAIFVKNT